MATDVTSSDVLWWNKAKQTSTASEQQTYQIGNPAAYPLAGLAAGDLVFHPRYVNLFPTNPNSEKHNPTEYEHKWVTLLGYIFRGPLYLSDAPQISAGSRYEEPFASMNLKAWQMAADATTLLTGQNVRFDAVEIMGFRSFTGSDPLRVTVNFKFYMGMWGYNDGCIEVYNPMAMLTQLCLPVSRNGVLLAPGPNSYSGFAEVIKTFAGMAKAMSSAVFSDTMLSAVDGVIKKGVHAIDSAAQTLARRLSSNRGVYTLRIGAMSYSNLFCESAEPQFSTTVDENGYPIWGTLRMTFSSMFAANAGNIPIHRTNEGGA